MSGIFTYIYHKNHPSGGKHAASGHSFIFKCITPSFTESQTSFHHRLLGDWSRLIWVISDQQQKICTKYTSYPRWWFETPIYVKHVLTKLDHSTPSVLEYNCQQIFKEPPPRYSFCHTGCMIWEALKCWKFLWKGCSSRIPRGHG